VGLKKFATMREGRRPLVSTNPDHDFRVGESDKTYQHQPIGMAGFFVLTNTDRPQKVKDLKEVAGTLGFSSSQFRVWQTQRSAQVFNAAGSRNAAGFFVGVLLGVHFSKQP